MRRPFLTADGALLAPTRSTASGQLMYLFIFVLFCFAFFLMESVS